MSFKLIKGHQGWNPKIPLKVARVINLAADIIVQDIKEGITKHSRDIHNKPFKKLSPNTIASKRKKGYSNKPLLAEGKMKEVYVRKRADNQKLVAVVGINKRDRKVASGVHQQGTKPYSIRPKNEKGFLKFDTTSGTVYAKEVRHPGVPKREWFGVSKRAEKKCVKLARKMIKRELRFIGG